MSAPLIGAWRALSNSNATGHVGVSCVTCWCWRRESVTACGVRGRCSAVAVCRTGRWPSGCARMGSVVALARSVHTRRSRLRGPRAARFTAATLDTPGRHSRYGDGAVIPRAHRDDIVTAFPQAQVSVWEQPRAPSSVRRSLLQSARPDGAQLATRPGARMFARFGSRRSRWQLTPAMTHVRECTRRSDRRVLGVASPAAASVALSSLRR